MTMDGGTINDEMEGGTSMNFSQEVVQEFQISHYQFRRRPPESAACGAMNIVTRSGSNDFHGSGYFFYRDHNMAAYPGLARNPLIPESVFPAQEPGFLLGGPIKKDKLFFFFNYEHLNQTAVFGRAGGSSLRPGAERHLAGALPLQSVSTRASIITCQRKQQPVRALFA